MRFWSKGLGDRELIIDLSRGNITTENGDVYMRGVITEPVTWNYEITLFDTDVRGILRVAISFQALIYFAKNIGMVGTYFARVLKHDFGMKVTEEGKGKAEDKAEASQTAS